MSRRRHSVVWRLIERNLVEKIKRMRADEMDLGKMIGLQCHNAVTTQRKERGGDRDRIGVGEDSR